MAFRPMALSSFAVAIGFAALLGACSSKSPPWGGGLRGDARRVMEAPDSVELVAVVPPHEVEGRREGERPELRGQIALARATMASADERKRVSDVLIDAVDSNGSPAACFDPHHAATLKRGDKQVDVVICYQCSQMYVYGPGSSDEVHLAIDGAREPAMNAVFAAHQLPTTKPR